MRSLRPAAAVVVGGYDPSLAPEAYAAEGVRRGLHRARRGRGHLPRAAARAGEPAPRLRTSPASGTATATSPRQPRRGPWRRLADGELRLPRRDARVLRATRCWAGQVDVVETSRGCTFDCSFCSIIEMRGRNFHVFDFDRVLADIRDARDHGARAIFIVDDNITLDVARFEALCQAIVDAGLEHASTTLVQAMTSAIANARESLAPLMRQAGFRYVFLGHREHPRRGPRASCKASAKNARREARPQDGQRHRRRPSRRLHRHGMYVVGGLIVGNPGDTREAIEANLEFARRYVDWPYIQHPTPYPRTPMTRELARARPDHQRAASRSTTARPRWCAPKA